MKTIKAANPVVYYPFVHPFVHHPWCSSHFPRGSCDCRLDPKEERIRRLTDALLAVAGEVDSCGHSHMSILHDVGKIIEFASEVLKGRDPHEVLREMGT